MKVCVLHELLRRGGLVLLALFALLVRLPAAGAYTFDSFYEEGPVRIPPGQLLQGHVDIATGAFVTVAPCGALRNPGLPLSAAIYLKTQDGGVGPCGRGSSCPDDWFIVYSGVSSGYELVGPGNQHYAFNQAYSGDAIDTLDPFLLGAVLYYPYSGIQVNGNWYYFYITFKNGATWFFDYSGGLALKVDAYGNTINITRDSATGFVTQVTAGANSSRWIKYTEGTVNGAVRVTSIQLQYSSTSGVRTWTVGYDSSASPKIVSLTQPDGGVWGFTWGSSYTRSDGAVLPLLTRITDPRGNAPYTLAFDNSGRVSSLTNAAGGVYSYSWNQPIGTSGTVTAVAPGGGSSTASYSWANWHNTYLLVGTTNKLGESTTFSYTGSPNYLPLSSTDFRGRVTNFTWDSNGNLTSRSWITPAGATATESFTYGTDSGLTGITDPLNRTTTNTLNACGCVLTSTNPRGNQTNFTWDSVGNNTAVTNALNQTTSMTYGSCGELLTATDPLNHKTSWTYDGFLRPVTTTDANGKTVSYTYDSMDRPLTTSQTVNGQTLTTTNVFDANGNRVKMTDPKGQVWLWTLDAMNRATQATDPLGMSATIAYDGDGNVSTVVDRTGNTAAYTYDTADRLLKKTFTKAGATSPESTVTYSYNSTTHLLASVVDTAAPGNQTWSYVYDSLDRTTQVNTPNGTINIGLDDKINRRDSLQAGTQGTITYGFDNDDNIVSILQNGQTATLTYDKLDRLTNQSLPALPNPVTTAWGFDSAGFVSAITSACNASTLDSHSYTRDAVGNITQEVIGGANPSTSSFSYDDLYRLSTATVNGTSYSYVYDQVGNCTARTAGGVTTPFTFDSADHLTSVAGYAVTSDADGRVLGENYGGWLYT